MAKYTITHSCGCKVIHDIFGTNVHGEREKRAEWLAGQDCKECWIKAQNADKEIVEMKYSEYKNNFSDCYTVPNSYDAKNKTIKVYIKK